MAPDPQLGVVASLNYWGSTVKTWTYPLGSTPPPTPIKKGVALADRFPLTPYGPFRFSYLPDADGDQALALDPQLGVWGGAWSGHKLNPRNRFKYRPKFKRQNPQRLGNDEDGDADNTTTISEFRFDFEGEMGGRRWWLGLRVG